MQIDTKITYLLNGLYRLTRICLELIYTQLKLTKNMLDSYCNCISKSYETLLAYIKMKVYFLKQ